MKLPTVQMSGVQSLGRANLGAVSQVASAVGGVAQAQSGLTNKIAQVALDFKKREDEAEFNSAITEAQIEMDEFERKFAAKEFYTSAEVEGVPDGAVRRTTSGTDDNGNPVEVDRNDIPAYQVYPYMLQNKMQGLMKQKAEGISNPFLREQFENRSAKIASSKFLKAGLAAEKQQQRYLKEVAMDSSLQSAINGNLGMAELQINEAQFSAQETKELIRNRREVYEWGNDSDIINTRSIKAMSARLEQLQSKSYGKGEGDYLGADKASGQYNLESNIRRFKSALTTTKGAHSNEARLYWEELIKSRSLGTFATNPLYRTNNYREVLNNDSRLKDNERRILLRDAEIAHYEGQARTQTRLTTFEEDEKILRIQEMDLQNVDATKSNEISAAYKGKISALKYKRDAMEKDATTYLSQNNDVIKGMYEQLERPEVKNNPDVLKQKKREFYIASRYEQERIGISSEAVNFLPFEEVAAFKEASDNVGRTSTGVAKLMLQIQSAEKDAQHEWAAVYSQLIREGAIKPEHVAASTIKDTSLQVQYLDAVANKESIEKSPFYKDNITDVRRDISVGLLNLRKTLLTPGAPPNVQNGLPVNSQLQALEDGVTQIIMSEVAATGKYDPSRVKEITEKVMNDGWKFYNNVRVPRNKKFDVDLVIRGLGRLDLGKQYEISDKIKFAGIASGVVSPKDDQDILKQNFIDHAVPSTNTNETGIIFKYASGNPVMIEKNGQTIPLMIPYEKIAEHGRDSFDDKGLVKRNKLVIE